MSKAGAKLGLAVSGIIFLRGRSNEEGKAQFDYRSTVLGRLQRGKTTVTS